MADQEQGSVGLQASPVSPSPSLAEVVATPSGAAEASVKTSPATCYAVQNGWAWAQIFVRHGIAKANDRDRHWVHVAVISDYGSFGYCWSHIGADWRRFLSDLDMHYAMQKFMGERFRVPLDGDEAQTKARALILRDRREGNLDKADARTLWDAALTAEPYDGCAAYLRSWDYLSDGLFYAREYWDCRWDKVNPQASGFWEQIWPHFVETLAEEGAQHASDTREARQAKPAGDRTQISPTPSR